MQVSVACVKPAIAADKREAAYKSRMHKLLHPHKQSEMWNVLALSNGSFRMTSSAPSCSSTWRTCHSITWDWL